MLEAELTVVVWEMEDIFIIVIIVYNTVASKKLLPLLLKPVIIQHTVLQHTVG